MEEAKRKKLTIQLKEEEHRNLKTLAATKGVTIKSIIMDALDAMFPTWRKP